jgi:hypothetical protein
MVTQNFYVKNPKVISSLEMMGMFLSLVFKNTKQICTSNQDISCIAWKGLNKMHKSTENIGPSVHLFCIKNCMFPSMQEFMITQ